MPKDEIAGFTVHEIRPNPTRDFLYSGSNFPVELSRKEDGTFVASAFGGDLTVEADSQENAVRSIRAALHQRALRGDVRV